MINNVKKMTFYFYSIESETKFMCNFTELETPPKIEHKNTYLSPDFSRWKVLCEHYLYEVVFDEAVSHVKYLERENTVHKTWLMQFHSEYIFWFFAVINARGIYINTVFTDEKKGEHNYASLFSLISTVDELIKLLRFTTDYLFDNHPHKESKINRIEMIREYVKINIEKNITRQELAKAIYLNPEYLSRFFKKEMGCTLSDYLMREKMNMARSLLLTTSLSVSTIAGKVGYSNFSHFAQCFRKEFGVSPSEYRSQNSTNKTDEIVS